MPLGFSSSAGKRIVMSNDKSVPIREEPSVMKDETASPSKNDKWPQMREVNVLPPEIWRQYEGKVIVYSEDEKRVIGVGDTEDEAFDQAEASGVGGLWHVHHAAVWGGEGVLGGCTEEAEGCSEAPEIR
jgi:hypothetical protein